MISIYSLTILLTALVPALLADDGFDDHDKSRVQDSIRFLQRLEAAKQNVAALKNNIVNLDGDLEHKQKRTCRIGLNSESCKTVAVDDAMNALDWMSNGFSPGKRSADKADQLRRNEEMLKEILRRRQSLQSLRGILEKAENRIAAESKRTCRMNLGGHCQTELASAIAEQWHYLNSPISPGRKKRAAGKFSNLLRS